MIVQDISQKGWMTKVKLDESTDSIAHLWLNHIPLNNLKAAELLNMLEDN